jgi:HEPN domain-containing protein
MRPEVREEVQDWLRRAARDLLAAERVLQGPEPLADVAVFHAQQSAEKALKAFLTAHEQVFEITHDLEAIVRRCERVEPEFGRFSAAAAILTPYAERFRYPGGPLEPSPAEAQQALQLAREIVAFVRARLGVEAS